MDNKDLLLSRESVKELNSIASGHTRPCCQSDTPQGRPEKSVSKECNISAGWIFLKNVLPISDTLFRMHL